MPDRNPSSSSSKSSKSKPPPVNAYRMTALLKNFAYKLSSSVSSSSDILNSGSTTPRPPLAPPQDHNFAKATRSDLLFASTDPSVDGEECLHDCSGCTIKYPRKFDIDETEELFGHVKGWSTHLLVATGKTDWVRDVADEKGSVMEAVEKGGVRPSNGKLMLSASNIPEPSHGTDHSSGTTVLLLPAWKFIDNVTPSNTPQLITDFVNRGPTNSTVLRQSTTPTPNAQQLAPENLSSTIPSAPQTLAPTTAPTIPTSLTPPLTLRPCPHNHLILMCSQRTRDARCGQSAPLLRREFERHLRPLGLYRDLHDERPGGVGIYFISHVGGHKFSANVMVYRRGGGRRKRGVEEVVRAGSLESGVEGLRVEDERGAEVVLDVDAEKKKEGENELDVESGEAAQCIWLARVRPEDCENIVRYTVLQGKVVKPARQLRGGFDRERGVASW